MNKFFLIVFLLFLLMIPVNATLQDDFAQKTVKNFSIPENNLEYNYNNTDIVPIKLHVIDKIRSEQHLYEGQIINFEVSESAYYMGKTIVRRGTIVPAKVETIIANGMNGIPASVIFGSFQIPNVPNSKLSTSYEKYGMDLSLLVFPIKWALTILPPTGSLTNFIKGGHVKISPKQDIIIYYHPKWT